MRYKSGGSESFDSMLFYLKNLELCLLPMGDADFHLLLDGVDGWMDDHLKVPCAILLGECAGIAVSNHPPHPYNHCVSSFGQSQPDS